jgi:low affinity Fe/Cu permease/uncharacterized membrane protein
MPRED